MPPLCISGIFACWLDAECYGGEAVITVVSFVWAKNGVYEAVYRL